MTSNLIRARSRGKTGLIDCHGVVVTPFEYDAIHELFDGARSFLKDQNVGFLGAEGNVLIKEEFRQHFFHVPRFSEELAAISKDDKFGFIDKAGNWTIQPKWTVAYDMFLGQAIVESEAGYFIINRKGDILSDLDVYDIKYKPGWPVDWDRIMCLNFDENENLMTSFCDSSGNIVFPPTYPEMTEFFEGIAGFCVYDQDLIGRWGLVGEAGVVIEEPGFSTLSGGDVPSIVKTRWWLVRAL